MKISTRGEYGLRILMELGMEAEQGLALREIAERQHISLDYLEQIVPALKQAGLVRARRGAHGGYFLAKNPADITILEALVALEGPFDLMLCVSHAQPPSAKPPVASSIVLSNSSLNVIATDASCPASGACAVQEVWQEMKHAVEAVLTNLTLEELLRRQEERYGVPIRTYAAQGLAKLTVLN
jgi:Rrf2 family protein